MLRHYPGDVYSAFGFGLTTYGKERRAMSSAAAAEEGGGRWSVQSSTDSTIRKGASVELVLQASSLLIKVLNGPSLEAPYDRIRLEPVAGSVANLRSQSGASVTLRAMDGIDPRRVADEIELRRSSITPTTPIAIFSYPGRTQADAAELFARHALILARDRYRPTSQSWGEGRPGAGRVVMLGVLATAIRPAGFLTVTYQKPDEDAVASSHAPKRANLPDAGPPVSGRSGSYRRLLRWATAHQLDIEVDRVSADDWSVDVSIDDPVTFTAIGHGPTIDAAAEQVLEQLDTVGAEVD